MASIYKDNTIIEKLTQNNYSNWKFKMNMLLIKEDLYDLIEGEPPVPITDQWTKRDNKARALINLFIADEQIVFVREERTAKQTWIKLKNIHERSNLSSKLYLLRKLYSTKLDEKGNMHKHITNILQIVDKLRAINEDIKDSHLTAILLCSVPPSYDTLITALEARPEEELNSQFVQNKLTDEFNRRVENMNHSDTHAKAFHLNKKQNYNQNSKRDNTSTKYCTHCKMRNHSNSNCWHLNKKNNAHKYKNQGFKSNHSSFCQNREPPYDGNSKDEHFSEKFKNTAFLTSKNKNNTWIIDSGSSAHISNNEELFTEINDNKSEVTIANGKSLTSYGTGNIEIKSKIHNGETRSVTLKNVLYVPELQTNLLSVNKATQNGHTVIFRGNKCEIINNNEIYLEAELKDNLYEVNLASDKIYNCTNVKKSCSDKNCIDLWHRRLGHRNYNSIKELNSKQMATGLKINHCQHNTTCENCIITKLTSDPYPKVAQNRSTKILELIHSDLCGPMKTPTIGGKFYILTFIDDYSRFTFIYLISKKNEVFEKLKEYVASVQNKFGRKPKALRSDNGTEYKNKEIEMYLKTLGIEQQFSIPHCSSQNGTAERKNRSLIEMTRSLLTEANLPHKFWGEAVNTANYLQNRLPTSANPCTPYQLWTGKKPDLKNLRVFGCKTYTYIDKVKRSKLENKAEVGTFVGYDNRSKGYRVYHGGKNITIARTAKFLENEFLYSDIKLENTSILEKENDENSIQTEIPNNEQNSISIEINEPNDDQSNVNNPDNQPQIRKSDRHNKGVPPNRFSYLVQNEIGFEPKNWNDLIKIENKQEKQMWINATQEEIKSLEENNTWTLVDLPKGKRIIGSRWTFKKKFNNKGEIDKYKARLVAKGYSQKYGEDYDETYAPVVSYTTIRSFLANALYKKLNVNHLDVKTAFLHGELEEEVYMNQPEGYIIPGKENKVCKLNRAIYGLKQAARAWHIKIGNTLKSIGFIQSDTEQCLFKMKIDNDTIYMIVYVDDLLIAGKQHRIDKIVKDLQNEYEINNLGEISLYLGMNIIKTKEGYCLNHKQKIKELVNKFKLTQAKPCNTPIEPGYKNTNDDENLLPNNILYRQAIGALLYISSTCRPDICAAVNILSRRNEKPRQKDWIQVKHIIRYLNSTINLNLIISSNSAPILTAYADADWGGDQTDRKSTSGNLLLLGKTPILWSSKKQTSVSLSSAEAEFISAATAAQEIIWLIKLLNDLDLQQQIPITLYEDNQPAIKMISTGKYTNKSKHVDIKFNFIKDLHEKGTIKLEYLPSKSMTADILTKPVPKPCFLHHRKGLQLEQDCDFYQDSEIEGEY